MLLLIAACDARTLAQTRRPRSALIVPAGIAWRVQGNWQQDAPPDARVGARVDARVGAEPHLVQTGSLILPGSLLLPVELQGAHSITIFLPDGQRILYECFTEEDCSRGFRVPVLTERPTELAVRMMRQMSGELLHNVETGHSSPQQSIQASSPNLHTTFPNLDEAVVTPNIDGNVAVGGLLSTLPTGTYTYNLISVDRIPATRIHSSLKKASQKCVFPTPGSGLFEMTILDAQNIARIDLFLAVIQPSQTRAFSSMPTVRSLLAKWNAQYYGWPIHELLRAYLASLMEAGGKHR